MTDENKLVVDGLRLSYNGIFDIIDFYKTVEDWIRENGYEKEIKKKLEHVIPTGKKLEWHIEIWKQVYDWARIVVSMRALFNNVKEVELEKAGAKRRLNHGDALIIFDAWLEMDLEGRWQQKPGYFFLRTLFDKFVYMFWGEKEKVTTPLKNDTYKLHKRLTAFFNLYRY
ncbi:hypothetical protein KY360_05485 [Candidatus Woesearchaeota archaeon]|nr:hypothetical protein [Candidatus Woesearchaeota archaeon]